MKYTPEHLTNLLTTDKAELSRICAEVCYGWKQHPEDKNHFLDADGTLIYFVPLANKVRGRSQAFELADKFGLELDFNDKTVGFKTPDWRMENGYFWDAIYAKEGMQAAIVIAAILTAQQENNDE